MNETSMGPQLRDWFQAVGLLDSGQDFADRRARGGPISVQLARTFILNYFRGASIDAKQFDVTETTPELCATGVADDEWERLRQSKKDDIWTDPGLLQAGAEFAKLVKAQRSSFVKGQKKFPPDYPEKATNPAVMAAWAYTSGLLKDNDVRLKRHFALSNTVGHDPLNVAALVKGRHKTDSDQYRGLGYRTDPKERGRFAELFFLQADNGDGFSKSNIDMAIAKYHAKLATLEVEKLKAKSQNG